MWMEKSKQKQESNNNSSENKTRKQSLLILLIILLLITLSQSLWLIRLTSFYFECRMRYHSFVCDSTGPKTDNAKKKKITVKVCATATG